MNTEHIQNTPENNDAHALQRPLVLIAVAVMFSGILVAGSIVATRIFPMPSIQNIPAVQKDTTKDTIGDKAVVPVPTPSVAQDGTLSLSLGDDPVLGDKAKAKLAIVEFSDYECPFCRQFHTETFDALVKKYVDTGKAVLSFKDFPLSFHEPMASKEASAANCVQKLSGDKVYFAFNASVYANTAANGKGMSDDKMKDLAVSAGVSSEDFTACVASSDFKDEIAQDQAEGEKVGVTGTPAFVIGTLNADGTVTNGVSIVGAQPLDAFEKVIDDQLKK